MKIQNKFILLLVNFLFLLVFLNHLLSFGISNNNLIFYIIFVVFFNFYGLFKNYSFLISAYFLISYLLIIYYRSPEIFIYGRFFAEEGSVYWTFSLVNNYIDTLQHVVPIGGYYTLNVNLTMILIKLFPISIAPYISIFSSLLISLIPALLTYKYNIFSTSELEKNYIFGLFLFLHSLNWPEIALNTINSQVFLAVAVFFIITFGLKSNNLYFSIFEQIILFISFLSSFYAVVQFPIIFLRFLQKKNNYLLFTFITAFISSLFQSLVFYFSKLENILYYKKADVLPELSYIFKTLIESFLLNIVSSKYWSFTFIGILIFLFTLYLLRTVDKLYTNYLILLNLVLQLILVTYGQAADYFAERYAVVLPTIAITYFLFLISQKFKKQFFVILIIIFLTNSISFILQSDNEKMFSCNQSCIKWSNQVNADVIEHWPIGDTWVTDMKNPKPAPSIKTISTFEFEYEKYYNFKINNLFKFLIYSADS